ncbi:hypothetical protein CCMA1212_005010 [Trichoderma ghanense]|uniref:Peptidase metallopeptidase domain-containing protein n=1 Tax=Trichoderma ghanense TaxID=65468 RepID=A0ABY2H3V5_9HYPO
MRDLPYSYSALRPHLYLSANDIALIEAARLANGHGHSCSDAAVHGTLDGTADGTLQATPDDTPDGSSVGTPTVIDHGHVLVDAMCTGGFCGGHGADPILNGLRVHELYDHIWSPNDEYPPELEIGDEGDEAAGLPPSTIAEKALAADRLHQLPDLFRILDPAFSYNCATERLACVELRIGSYGRIPRWRKGSELSYIVCTESFPPPLSLVVEDAMKQAISMWQGIGVSFKQVPRDSRATFAVRFEGGKCKGYAISFLPDTEPAELLVYEKSESKAEYLSNILAHEVGHILGLRHGFAHKRERGNPSVFFGSEDDQSVMLYYDHLRKHKVSELDLQGVRDFYEYDQAEYDGLKIEDVEPKLHDFGEAHISSRAMRESAADRISRRYSH